MASFSLIFMKQILVLFFILAFSFCTYAASGIKSDKLFYHQKQVEKSLRMHKGMFKFLNEDQIGVKSLKKSEKKVIFFECGGDLIIAGCNGFLIVTKRWCDYYGIMMNLVLVLAARESCLENQ